MADFIEDFYFGNIDPQARNVKGILKSMELLSTNEELLTERLSGEDRRLFLEFVNAWDIVMGHSDTESFTTGFRMGAKFTYDTFVSNKT